MDTVKGILALAGSLVTLYMVAVIVQSPHSVQLVNAVGGQFGSVLKGAKG